MNNNKKVATCKQWTTPVIISINQKELAAHIQAAARSGNICYEGHGRRIVPVTVAGAAVKN